MTESTPTKLLASIRESECIGCTKCIQACPFDAILGSAKRMHTVLSDICTGCELCVAPCPVDCIDMLVIPQKSAAEEAQLVLLADERKHTRELRLEKNTKNQNDGFQKAHEQAKNVDDKKRFIAEALLRAKLKKLS